jgi:glucose/arabinose dehydrogenase
LAGTGGAPSGSGGSQSATAGSGGASTSTGGTNAATSSGGSEQVNVGGLDTPVDPGKSSGGASAGPAAAPLIPGTERYACAAPTGTLPPLELVPVVTGLSNPIYVTHAPGETERLLVLEQTGTIQIVRDGTVGAAPFLDITDRVILLTWEQGLLGLAFHPRFAENGLFYLHYNGNGDGSAVISEFRASSDPDVADPASERVLLSLPTVDGYHNGGSLNFGPDGLLYIGIGDGGGLAPPPGSTQRGASAQDLTSLRGGMLRIDPTPSGDLPYTLPSGNLVDVNAAAAPELWSKGLRNPYRSNFDPCTGALYRRSSRSARGRRGPVRQHRLHAARARSPERQHRRSAVPGRDRRRGVSRQRHPRAPRHVLLHRSVR